MIIVMQATATPEQIERVVEVLRQHQAAMTVFGGVERTVIAVHSGAVAAPLLEAIEVLPGIEQVTPFQRPFKLASREVSREQTVVDVGGVPIGGRGFVIIAGPCSGDNRSDLLETAKAVAAAGASIIRGGAPKDVDDLQPCRELDDDGLANLREARRLTGLPVLTEVLDTIGVDRVLRSVDMVQIGTANMQNFPLLRELGRTNEPVLLKRGLATTVEEWLTAAERILREGNPNVVLCERGIRTYEPQTASTLDLSAIPAIRRLSHLPVVVDVSHGAGHRYLVQPMSLAAAAAGADGIMVEVHPSPDTTLAHGPQSISTEAFAKLMAALPPLLAALGRLPILRPASPSVL